MLFGSDREAGDSRAELEGVASMRLCFSRVFAGWGNQGPMAFLIVALTKGKRLSSWQSRLIRVRTLIGVRTGGSWLRVGLNNRGRGPSPSRQAPLGADPIQLSHQHLEVHAHDDVGAPVQIAG